MSFLRSGRNNDPGSSQQSKAFIILSIVGFLIFSMLQVILPYVAGSQEPTEAVLTEEKAIKQAEAFLQQPAIATSIAPPSSENVTKNIEIIYHTNADLSGYISHADAEKDYVRWEKKAPYNIYRVLVHESNKETRDVNGYERLTKIDVHMTTGQVVGFQTATNMDRAAQDEPVSQQERWKRSDQAVRLFGWSTEELKRIPSETDTTNFISYDVPRAAVGDARLKLQLEWQGNALKQMLPAWIVPSSYSHLMEQQKSAADNIQSYVYVGMSFVLSIASIVIAIRHRKRISFRSRSLVLLSIISCSISILHIWNMTEGYFMVQEQFILPEQQLRISILIQAGFTVIQGGLALYFSLVSGRWTWQHTKYSAIIPGWSDDHFGDHLVQAFWKGVCWTGILLGAQTIIFELLEMGLDSWVASDALNSPLNLSVPVLFPLMAWVAAISEEGFFRLFGVGLFHRFIRNVWVASLIPTFVWAAGHVTYPIYPYYSRPIELMVIGLLFVWIMLKHGFWTAVVAHLMFDTALMSIGFLLGTHWTDVAIGFFYILMPLAMVHLIRYLHSNRKRKAPADIPPPPSHI